MWPVQQGMGDFLGEMATMMSQNEPTVRKKRKKEKRSHSSFDVCLILTTFLSAPSFGVCVWQEDVEESFEELQDLFEEMFQRDVSGFASSSSSHSGDCSSSSSKKRNCSDMNSSCSKSKGEDGMSSDSSTFGANQRRRL